MRLGCGRGGWRHLCSVSDSRPATGAQPRPVGRPAWHGAIRAAHAWRPWRCGRSQPAAAHGSWRGAVGTGTSARSTSGSHTLLPSARCGLHCWRRQFEEAAKAVLVAGTRRHKMRVKSQRCIPFLMGRPRDLNQCGVRHV